MLFIYISSILAAPAIDLNIIPLDEVHPARAAVTDFVSNSFVSSDEVKNDIKQLERYVKEPFERNWEKLPITRRVSQDVWPGPYWPTYEDGINNRWDGPESLSAVEKYAKAFNLDVTKLADAVSKKSGVDSQSRRQKCKTWSDCKDGTCAIRRDKTEGYCIPTWFGICHAWSPAALIEPEPLCAVTVNGIKFEPMDMKGLISQIYDSANVGTIFTGQRCNLENPKFDDHGRYVDAECRDISPEFFHLAVTNMLGRFDKSFVVDVSADFQVWNQPVRSYEIMSQVKISPAEAMEKYFPAANSTTYIFNEKAKELLLVNTRLSYVLESNENTSGLSDGYTTSRYYDYLLELDAQGSIIGGEWVDYAKSGHIDFLWFPVGTPSASVSVTGGIKYSEVRKMIDQSLKSC